MHTYIHTHIHTYILLHTYIPTYTYIHTHTYIHIHTYIHTHTCNSICITMSELNKKFGTEGASVGVKPIVADSKMYTYKTPNFVVYYAKGGWKQSDHKADMEAGCLLPNHMPRWY